MNCLLQLWRRILHYVRRNQFDRELEEEMRFHLEMKAEEYVAAGMTPGEALRAARRQFGNETRMREMSREAWGFAMLDTLLQDVRFGARVLAKHRGFTAVAVLTLALGIGANTAIFSVVNAVLLRPLPFERPDRLVRVYGTSPRRNNFARPHSYLNFSDLRAQNQTFESMAAYSGSSAALSGADAPEQITGAVASGDIFVVLGTRPLVGRLLTPEDEKPGGSPVVVISHGLWQRRFGGDL